MSEQDAVQAAKDKVYDLYVDHGNCAGCDLSQCNAALDVLVAAAVAQVPCYGAHPYNAGYLEYVPYRDAQKTEEDRQRAEAGFCLTCKARADLPAARTRLEAMQ